MFNFVFLDFETLDLASQLANINRDFKKNKLEIDNFIKQSLSAKPAQVQQDKSLKITQIGDRQLFEEKIESPKEIGSGSDVFVPGSDDEDVDTFVYEEEDKKPEKVVLITEAPDVVDVETTRNQEFYDYVEQNYRSKEMR